MTATTAPRIRREVTRDGDTVRYVYSFCTACTYWHAFEWSVAKAYEQGERHLINVHGIDPKAAMSSRHKAAERARQHEHTNEGDRP